MTQQTFEKTYRGSAPENYEKYFVPAIGAPLADDLIEAAELRPGERVLDVACGTGVVTRLAAARVGEDGSVAGLDVDPGMLAVARALGPDIDWYETSAEAMPLSDEAFDVVLCQMGLQFVPNKLAALKEMRRITTAHGRLVISLPGPTPEPFAILADAMARHIDPKCARFVSAVFSLSDTDELEKMVTEAGFDDADVHSEKKTLRVPASQEFLWQYIYSTPLGQIASQATEEQRQALTREVVEEWAKFARDGAMEIEVDMTTIRARRSTKKKAMRGGTSSVAKTLLATLAVAVLVGCGPDLSTEVGVCQSTSALSASNGRYLNALSLNGLMLNGRQYAWNNGRNLGPVQGLVTDGRPELGEKVLVVDNLGQQVELVVVRAEQREGLRYLEIETEDGLNPCGETSAEAMIVRGVWDLDNGTRHDALTVGEHELRHSLSCVGGVIAKCVVWGYGPETNGADVHQTCVRMARADYCGDGTPNTEDGTPIDVFDRLGLNDPTPSSPMTFEAAWSPNGAVCVNHPRYLDVTPGGRPLHPRCWADLPRCADALAIWAKDAVIMNASSMQQRLVCGER